MERMSPSAWSGFLTFECCAAPTLRECVRGSRRPFIEDHTDPNREWLRWVRESTVSGTNQCKLLQYRGKSAS